MIISRLDFTFASFIILFLSNKMKIKQKKNIV